MEILIKDRHGEILKRYDDEDIIALLEHARVNDAIVTPTGKLAFVTRRVFDVRNRTVSLWVRSADGFQDEDVTEEATPAKKSTTPRKKA
jgi:hypothetical protein